MTGRRKPAAEPAEGVPLVGCVDGPMVGQWFTETDWNARQEAAQRMAARGQRPAACLLYRFRPGRPVAHPSGDGRVGKAATAAGTGRKP